MTQKCMYSPFYSLISIGMGVHVFQEHSFGVHHPVIFVLLTVVNLSGVLFSGDLARIGDSDGLVGTVDDQVFDGVKVHQLTILVVECKATDFTNSVSIVGEVGIVFRTT